MFFFVGGGISKGRGHEGGVVGVDTVTNIYHAPQAAATLHVCFQEPLTMEDFSFTSNKPSSRVPTKFYKSQTADGNLRMAFQRSSLFTQVICVSHRKYRLKETEGPTQATESVGSRMDRDPVSSQTEGAVMAVPVG